MKRYISVLITIWLSVSAVAQISVPLRFDKYHTYAETVEAIKALEKTYPNLAKAVLVGKSEENREIWALEINNPKTGNSSDKPGVYSDGNIHGNEIQASEVVLYLADYLLKNYGKVADITKIVDRNVFYLIPIVNVDGRYHFMADGNSMNNNRGLRIARDDDRDGLFDEDAPDDLDGDGNISQMRICDPNGKFRTDPREPRLMIRVKDGEQGEWTLLGNEGIDNDGDGQLNEDAEGYVDPNRNWGSTWQPNYVQQGSGNFPFEGVGLKSIADYMQARPNIIVVYAFHNYGGMFLRGPGNKLQPPYNQMDVEVYDILGQHAEKMVPGYRYLISWKDLYATQGDFTDFTHNVFGAYSFVGELYMTSQETYTKGIKQDEEEEFSWRGPTNNDREIERLKFNDNLAHGTLFKEWTSFKHPVYGDIEIGGWIKYSTRMPHPFMLPELVHRNASAVIYAASQTPDIELELIAVRRVEGKLYEVDVRLKNRNAIPSISYHAAQKNVHPKDILRLSGGKVIAGGQITDRYTNKVNYKTHKPQVQLVQVPGYDICEYRFLVEGSGSIELTYHSIKAGKRSLRVNLK
ncbi:MAG: M14 family metallopeptidase [Tenuifilaceae bacterium]|jgi:hypothetical protein|nr:M14 family metallopeptidase [Tenuifilaceae bacterium]